MAGSIAGNYPAINDYLMRTLRTGGIDGSQAGQLISNLGKSRVFDEQRMTRDVLAAQPLGSTAAVSALTGGMGEIGAKYRGMENQFLLDLAQQEEANKAGALGGMMNLPGYLAAPGSMELSAIQALTPYDQMNMESDLQMNNIIAQLIANSMYTPEVTYRDTPWGSLLGAAMKALPMFFMGG